MQEQAHQNQSSLGLLEGCGLEWMHLLHYFPRCAGKRLPLVAAAALMLAEKLTQEEARWVLSHQVQPHPLSLLAAAAAAAGAGAAAVFGCWRHSSELQLWPVMLQLQPLLLPQVRLPPLLLLLVVAQQPQPMLVLLAPVLAPAPQLHAMLPAT